MADRVIWGGRYAIFDEIASGGMATVYLAARLGASQDIPAVVALKKLSAQLAKQPEFVAMFLDEAHLAARVRHPNVVTTYEFVRTSEGLGIIMDLVVGESLVVLLRGTSDEIQRVPIHISAAILVDALEGLHAAHEAKNDIGVSLGLVHRDISPHNILVGKDGVARVIDFGIAKAIGRLQTTDVGVIKGKFAYMAPEQIQGATLDRATDLYSAGIVLWETIAGRKLFKASADEELLMQRTAGSFSIPPPSSTNGKVPRALERVVLRALETKPRDRFATAQEMAEAIRSAVALATREEVGAWVEERAGARLSALQAGRRAILESMAGTLAEGAHGIEPLPAPGADVASPNVISVRPGPHGTKPSAQAVPGIAGDSPRQRFGGDLVLDEGRPAPLGAKGLELEPPSLGEAVLPPSSFAPPAIAEEMRRRSRPPLRSRPASSRWGVVAGAVVLVLLVVVALLALAAPSLLAERVARSASQHGLVVVVQHVEPTREGLTLHGVSASLVGTSSLAWSAAEARVELDHGGNVVRVTLPGYELHVRGSVRGVADALEAWWKTHPEPLAVDGHAGHLVWTGAFAPGVSLEALDLSIAESPGESALAFDTTSLIVNLPHGHTGPWHAHLDVTQAETRARLGFDPASPEAPPSLTYVERALDGGTWSLEVPRASTFKLGIPTEVLGLASDLTVEMSVRVHEGAHAKSFSADAHVGLFGLRVGSPSDAKTPIDLVLDGKAEGDPASPLPIRVGRLAAGTASGPLSGTLTVRDDGLRVLLDRPSARGSALPGLAFDSRTWTDGAPAVTH